ncbi:GNAT family N-acetyltransferase [Actinomyces haliotis]|uniref:GNAT family N-acetyltransferase n=1 Tax=Actinomyces haliotis TaxID=1280843 RepID=UPI00188FBD0C|nr:GNAT family N-acetyltransferase [Actinomyces haliotis]
MTSTQDDSIRILREDDPEHARLLAEGWEVVAESWGARLRLGDDADLSLLLDAVAVAQDDGYSVERLHAQDAEDLRTLQAAVLPDYPATPATPATPAPDDLEELLRTDRWLAFGARAADGSLAAFTTIEHLEDEDRWEVDRTAVARKHRRHGLAKAVKALSILTTYSLGARVWGTGGAAVNAGSLAMNKALGFELEPLWHSLRRPGA